MLIQKFFLACLAVGLASAANCNVGKQYWCASIQQAAQCNALPYCIQTVWSSEKVAVDTDEVCDICKDMVTQARDTLQSNETQEELKEVFEGSCDLIPIKIVRKECKVLADEFVPELVETLSSQMNPDSVCTVAGLCNSQRIDKLLQAYYNKRGHCVECRVHMSKARTALTTISDSELQSRLLDMCGGFDSYSDACMFTVTGQLPVIRSMLKVAFNENSCVKSVCKNKDLVRLTSQNPADLECEFCTKVVKHWIDVYASDASLEQFKEILDGLCDKLHKGNSAHCRHIVDDYYIPLFEYVRRMDPHVVCSLVGICKDDLLTAGNSALPLTLLFPPLRYTELTPLIKASRVDDEDKPTCLLCEFVMQKLETYLKDEHTAEEVKQYLDEICDKVPGSYANVCQSFVDKYEAVIVQMIADEIHPAEICKEVKLCPEMQPRPSGKSTGCETCHMVAQEVFSVFSNKDDQDMVRNVLESFCYRFPDYIDQPCEEFVDKYTAAFLDFVSKGLTPDELCYAIDMCATKYLAPVDYKDDSGCVICEYAVSYLDKMLTNKTNEEEIKRELEMLCDYMPGSVRKECDAFVSSYTDMIIQLLAGEITPKEVCGYLGLCKNSVQTNLVRPLLPVGTGINYANKLGGDYCPLCEYVMTTIDQMLEDKKTEKEIEIALDRVCYVLPSSVTDQCIAFIKQNTDQIIHLLVNDYPPQQVCSQLGLC